MKSLSKPKFNYTCILLVFLTFLCSCKGQETNKPLVEASTFTIKKVLADSISQLADTLPEFKNDLNAKESQGNQISGVIRTVFQDSKKTTGLAHKMVFAVMMAMT